MLKFIQLSFLILLLPMLASANSSQFEEGKHYQTLTTEKSKSPQVVEFFSYFCGHCYRFEPIALALEESLPDNAQFVKSHVNFLGSRGPEAQTNLSYAYIIAKQLGKGKAFSQSMFNAIHEKRLPMTNIGEVKRVLNQHGIDEALFNANVSSMPVVNAERIMHDEQERFSKIGALTGVPTFIVNDKYKIIVSGLQNQQEMNELVQYLLKK